MKIAVTEEGALIPKEFLAGIEEIEIRKEGNSIIIFPAITQDPILEMGKLPVHTGVNDASVNHDKYLYGFAL